LVKNSGVLYMTTMIKPILGRKDNQFDSTGHRFFTMFTPIQKTQHKESDFLAYLATPLIDSFILEPAFAIDATIHLINALASLARAAYLWTLNQQHSKDMVDPETSKQLNDFLDHSSSFISALIGQTVNTLFSIIALFTRPLASLIQGVADLSDLSDASTNPNTHYHKPATNSV